MLVLTFGWWAATQSPLSRSTDLRDLSSLRGRQLPRGLAGGGLPTSSTTRAWLPLQDTRLASRSPAGLIESGPLSPCVRELEHGGLYPTQLLQGPFIVTAEKRAHLGKDMAPLLPKPAAEAGKEGWCPASAHVSPLPVKGARGEHPPCRHWC